MQANTTYTPPNAAPVHAPKQADYLLFFLGIPAATAVLFALVGIRLTAGMPYLDSLGYMLIHMFIAWWSVSLGSSIVKQLFRSWQPPVIAVCTLGYFLTLIPTAFVYQNLGDWYGSMYPSFAAARADSDLASWHLGYLLHFIRYSIPALPLFLAGVYGHKALSGVHWFSYPQQTLPKMSAEPATETALATGATAGLLPDTKLPADAILIAIKAEQHYIHIWTDQGTDMVRFRFKDLDSTLAACNGGKVHRSWWINFEQVRTVNNDGRKLELVMNGDANLVIPVSTSFKNSTLEKLQSLAV